MSGIEKGKDLIKEIVTVHGASAKPRSCIKKINIQANC